MCYDARPFVSLKSLPVPLSLNVTNSFKIIVTHVGSVFILPNLILENVLYVSVFKYNLLSVHRFCCQYKCDLLFTPSGCVLQDPIMKNTHDFGKVNGGLYLLQPSNSKCHEDVISFQKGSNSNSSPSSISASFSVLVNDVPNIDLWHV